MFVDKAIIQVRGGRGGDGAIAFRREKFVPKGGPAGGDGGDGGSVILVATHRSGTLLELASHPHQRAKNGQAGQTSNMTGRSAEDLVIEVPLGTLVRAVDAEGKEGRVLSDLTEEGQTFVAARGGKGGRGNSRFATSTNQTPRQAEPGEPGGERKLLLELKLIADVGLVGMPNAGKSTLISRVSAARPKIADYPFTTLTPVPGIVQLGEYRSCVIADLPGLIAGAHRGVGLGVEFLRHIERTRMIVHVVDGAPIDEKDPLAAYRQVRQELHQYGAGLEHKREIVAVNKLDLPAAQETVQRFREALPGHEVYAISAVTGAGIPELVGAIARHLADLGAVKAS